MLSDFRSNIRILNLNANDFAAAREKSIQNLWVKVRASAFFQDLEAFFSRSREIVAIQIRYADVEA